MYFEYWKKILENNRCVFNQVSLEFVPKDLIDDKFSYG